MSAVAAELSDACFAQPPRGSPARIALVTAGQSPRGDLAETIASQLPPGTLIVEVGMLDDLSPREISALSPRSAAPSLVTRLRDGSEIVVARAAVEERVARFLRGLSSDAFNLVCVLTTGLTTRFASSVPLVDLQQAMESAVAGLVEPMSRLAVFLPNQRQVDDAAIGMARYESRVAWLDAGHAEGWARAARLAADCDAIVLNSIAYDEATAERLAAMTGKPVVLPRRVIAGLARLLLDVAGHRPRPPDIAIPRPHHAVLFDRLTLREHEVMELMVEGRSSKAIAQRLGLSPRTVELHRARVLSKLGLGSTGALIRFALAGGTEEVSAAR